VGETLNSLGGLLALQGQQEEARSIYEQALAILSSQLPPRHPRLAAIRQKLGKLSLF
jgi:hypothetical protein